MQHELVIVRDSWGKALRRVALDMAGETVLVSSERALTAADSGAIPPIGVYLADVFRFDEGVLGKLECEWNENGGTRSETWNMLRNYA